MRRIDLHLYLREHPTAPPSWLEIHVFRDHGMPLSEMLLIANRDGSQRPRFHAPCLEGICGACAVRVDGRWTLACRSWIPREHPGPLVIQPAWEPVLADLIVDRARIEASFLAVSPTALHEKEPPVIPHAAGSPCTTCGLCLAVCPAALGPRAVFLGAGPLHQAIEGQETADIEESQGVASCWSVGACEVVCPSRLPLRSSLERLGRERLHSLVHRLFG